VNDPITTEGAIKKAEQYEALKQMLLRLLDDPQVQQKSSLCCAIGPEHVQRNKSPKQVIYMKLEKTSCRKPLIWTLKRSIHI
jgi:hypothetical protein